MSLVLGIDLGTSYFKAGLFDQQGGLCGLGRAPFGMRDGKFSDEISTEIFWQTLHEAIDEALRNAEAKAEQIVAIAYASQANSFVLLDKQDQPLTSILLWPKVLDEKISENIQNLWHDSERLKITGLDYEGPSLAMCKWDFLRRTQPKVWDRAAKILTLSDYLVYALTGEMMGDQGTASLLGILDIQRGAWWPRALDALKIHPEQLACPLPPGTVTGHTTGSANRIGMSTGVPLVLGSLDHHVAAIGAGAGSLAEVSESTGTVIACLRVEDKYCPQKASCVGPHYVPGEYWKLVASENGASLLELYQQTHAPLKSIEDLINEALSQTQRPATNDKQELESPACNVPMHKDHHIGEWIRQLPADHVEADAIYHILAVITDETGRLLDTLYPKGRPARLLATGGGARNSAWLQFKADRLGLTVIKPACEEPACLGAALLAAPAAGWGGIKQISNSWLNEAATYNSQN